MRITATYPGVDVFYYDMHHGEEREREREQNEDEDADSVIREKKDDIQVKGIEEGLEQKSRTFVPPNILMPYS